MFGTMQDVPLLVKRLLEHGSRLHGRAQVITAEPGGFRSASFADVGRNAARLAHALRGLGVADGERVATFMWNNQEHVEAYYAVPCMGAVLHPLNIRLPSHQVTFIANHAEDRVVIVDGTLLPLFANALKGMTTVQHVIVNGPGDRGVLDAFDVSVHDYAGLIDGQPDSYEWPELDERAGAAMCYTSGTTGEPKGVVYTHRSLYLHALGAALPDTLATSAGDRTLVIVPQFHVLAWGIPYTAFVTGTTMCMPDRFLTPAPLAEFIMAAKPNRGAGVPTVWQGLLNLADSDPSIDISSIEQAIVGGSACPPTLMEGLEQRHGLRLVHAWGMTEMSPLGTVARPPAGLSPDEEWHYRLTQGRFVAPVEARLVGVDGEIQPHDGEAVGELEVRGPWIAGSYYKVDDPDKFHDGWLRTGDIGTITPDGYLTLTDRAKDVIKSGGEWISSVELENELMAHPDVLEAVVVGVPDDKWGERPLAAVVLREGHSVTPEALRQFLDGRVAHWQVPERWTFIDEVPKTSVGKFDKKVVRQRYAEGGLDVERF
jgi:fatty-acyl-CoA synthase